MLDCLLNSLLTFSFILSDPDWVGSSEEIESLLSLLEVAASSSAEGSRGEIFLLASNSEIRVRTEGSSSGNLILTVPSIPDIAGSTKPLRTVSKDIIKVRSRPGQYHLTVYNLLNA